jgi:hypothetical protein
MRVYHPDKCLIRGRERSTMSLTAHHTSRCRGEGAALWSNNFLIPSIVLQATALPGNSMASSRFSFTALTVLFARTMSCTFAMVCWSRMPHTSMCMKHIVLTYWPVFASQVGAQHARAGSLGTATLNAN